MAAFKGRVAHRPKRSEHPTADISTQQNSKRRTGQKPKGGNEPFEYPFVAFGQLNRHLAFPRVWLVHD